MLTKPNQFTTLKNAILAEASLAAAVAANDQGAIAAFFNVAHATMIVWKTQVPTQEVFRAVNWPEFISRSAGEREAFRLMLSQLFFEFGDANIRKGIDDIYSGSAVRTVNTRADLYTVGKRAATKGEALFATINTNNLGTDASPGKLDVSGDISPSDVSQALSS